MSVLALPLVHVQPDDVGIAAREARIDVHERLRPVLAAWQVAQALDRVTERGGVDRGACTWGERADAYGEEWDARLASLLDRRLPPERSTDRHIDPTGDWLGAGAWTHGDLEALARQPAEG